ncbi:MAG: CapA family protein [Alphaproteobacteria bacterium]|nr:CapA family protein [Alphaproteobacteria bacterium]MDE2492845.1 CapA family protein [Alphaproteobacteria bacterium]
MRRRYGWGLDNPFGWFMSVAAAVLATANVSYGTALFLVAHYHANLGVAANYTAHINRYFPGPEQLATLEPLASLRPAMHDVHAPPPGAQIWLSATYKPGDPRLVDVVAAGDVMMGSIDAGLNPAITPGASASSLIGNDVVGIFRRANIAFVNLEGPLYDGPSPPEKSCTHCFTFRSPTYYAGVLQSFGVDVVSLANNHSGDYGEVGRDSTMAALRAHGIAFGGLDRNGARAATLVLPGGRKAAVVAFAPNDGTLDLNDLPVAEKLVRDLKKTHDLVIVSFHGGAEGWDHVHVAMGEEMFDGENRGDVVRFAHGVIDAGADIVVGQGPHVPRAVELYRRHLIAYSLGNFWTYEGVMTYAVSGLGPVLEAWLAPDGSIAGFTIHSTRQAGLGVPHADPEDEAARYIFYLTKTDFPETDTRLEEAQHNGSVASRKIASGS